MISYLVCAIQITAIGFASLLLGRIVLQRAPALSARIGLLGILACSTALLLTATKAPRLWELQSRIAHAEQQVESKTKHGPRESGLEIPMLEFSLDQPLQILAEFKSKQPDVDRRLRYGAFYLVLAIGFWALTRFLLGCYALASLIRESSEVASSQIAGELQTLSARHNLSKSIMLRRSGRIATPCICWMRPFTIFVPDGFERWSLLERKTALAHELQHIVRGDAMWRFFSELLACCISFHPVVWLLRREIVAAQEFATDCQAAQSFSNPEQYRKGLSMLALRMDSQSHKPMFLEVSVSTNSVVRRIQMLKKTSKPFATWQNALCVIAMFGIGICTLLCSARADDPVRVASRNKPKPVAAATFAQGAMQPDAFLGAQNGYFAIRPSALSDSKSWSDLLKMIEQDSEGSGYDLESIGLDQRNLKLIHLNAFLHLKVIPESERKEKDHRFTFTAGANGFVVETHEAVDWKQAWDKLPIKDIYSAVFQKVQEEIAEVFEEAGNSKSFSMVSENAETPDKSTILPEMMKLVDGGDIVFSNQVLVAPEVLAELKNSPADFDPMEAIPCLERLEAIAFGVDVDSKGDHHIRLALLPKTTSTAAEFDMHLQAFLAKCQASLKDFGDVMSLPSLVELSEQLDSCTADTGALKSDQDVILYEIRVPSKAVEFLFLNLGSEPEPWQKNE
ncbi:MAG: M56 family metallopeptidase [Planctomycetota bacterium]